MTVGELIEVLKKFDPKRTILIHNPDYDDMCEPEIVDDEEVGYILIEEKF